MTARIGSLHLMLVHIVAIAACDARPPIGGADAALDRIAGGDGAGDPGADLREVPVADVALDQSGDADRVPCKSDGDCIFGQQWCVKGGCARCDNSLPTCLISCERGWTTYSRHGCSPCECAPPNQCVRDSDCAGATRCYAGAFCWDWCPPGDPSCCFGNLCSAPGCTDPPPVGCWKRGCAVGFECKTVGCEPSSCGCGSGGWACTEDCGGGTCVPRQKVRSCLPACDRCAAGVCCGAGCCGAGEWCDETQPVPVCRCGTGGACPSGQRCSSGVPPPDGCGSVCCGGGVPCPP